MRAADSQKKRKIGQVCVRTHLNLIGYDSSRAELCADFVCVNRIEIDNTKCCDESVCLKVLQISQGGHITFNRVVLPIELEGHVKRRRRVLLKAESNLQKVEMGGSHACHALADGGLDRGARKFVSVFEYTPFGASEDGARWKMLLKLPLSE